MSNVIQFPVQELEHVDYDMENGMVVQDVGLKLLAGFDKESDDGDAETVFIAINGEGIYTDRKRLAQFLWCAVRMIDSEGRYESGDYPARNYES